MKSRFELSLSLSFWSKIPGIGASKSVCTLIRTLGNAMCLAFISKYYQHRQTSPYWFSIWIEMTPKLWIIIFLCFFFFFFLFLAVDSILVNGWMNGMVSFLPILRTCAVNVNTCESSFSNPNQGFSVLLCWSHWGKKLCYYLKRKYSTFDQLALIESCFPTEYKQQRVWNPGSFMPTYWLVLCNFMQDMFLVSFPTSRVLKYAPWGAGE